MAGLSARRIAVLVAVSVALIASAVFTAGRIERDSAVDASQREQAAQRLLTSMLDQETGARGFFETGRSQFLTPWYRGAAGFASALATSRRLDGNDPALQQTLDNEAQGSAAWHAAQATQIDRRRATGKPPAISDSVAAGAIMDQFRATNALYETQLSQRRDSSLQLATWLSAGLVAVASIMLVLLEVLIARRSLRHERRRSQIQRELRELLEVSASEAESQRLMIRHAERIFPGSGSAVLNCNDVDDRLEPALADNVDQTPLRGIQIDQLRPRSCMAVRLSRAYRRGPGEDLLLACEVCGKLSGDVACEPLLVGGKVIGAVLVAGANEIPERARVQLRESAVLAAPILANQRNLAVAEQRAASDALTGLPNRRVAEETIKRMAAHAGRALSPLGVVVLDLDRFKQINDLHGHEQGDKALAAMAQVISATLRESDFAARYGGEEFLLLLPDTDRHGSLEVAEKVRRAIERAEMATVGSITGSLGVACLPEDAVDPDQLIRKADRALYAAKSRGRNRVEAAEPSGAGELRGGGEAI